MKKLACMVVVMALVPAGTAPAQDARRVGRAAGFAGGYGGGGSDVTSACDAVPITGQTTITEPGRYLVVRPIEGGAGPIITVQADHVDLDLGGHRIDAGSGGAIVAIDVADLEIFNGSFGPFFGGDLIRLDDVQGFTVRDVSVAGGTFSQAIEITGGSGTIESNSLTGEALPLIRTQQADVTIRDNLLYCGGECRGIFVACDGCRIEANTVGGGSIHGDAIAVTGSGNDVAGNAVEPDAGFGGGFQGAGIRIDGDGNVVRSNRVSETRHNAGAIDVRGRHNLIADNVMMDNNIGLLLRGERHVYTGNVAMDNGGGAPFTCEFHGGWRNDDFCDLSVKSVSGGRNFLPEPQ